MYNIGNVLRVLAHLAETRLSYRQAIRLLEELRKDNLDNLNSPIYLVGTPNNLTDELQIKKLHAQPLATIQKAVEYRKHAFDRAPRVVQYRRLLSSPYVNLARAYCKLWPKEPLELYKRVRKFLLATQLANKDSPEYHKYLDLALETLTITWQTNYRDFKHLRKDPGLTSLQAHPRFEKVLKDLAMPEKEG